MYAHFDYDKEIPDFGKLINSLNRLVGKDIAIYDIIKVAGRWYGVNIICSDHPKYTNAKITARFDACGKVETLLSVLERLIPGMEYTKAGSIIYLK